MDVPARVWVAQSRVLRVLLAGTPCEQSKGMSAGAGQTPGCGDALNERPRDASGYCWASAQMYQRGYT